MICYECQVAGKTCDAIALCHHCSAALCREHALTISDPITAQLPVCKTVSLPLRARIFLCSTCLQALRQTGQGSWRDVECLEAQGIPQQNAVMA